MPHATSLTALAWVFALVPASAGSAPGAERAEALRVEETIWGFSGEAEPQRFNLLSLRLSNSTASPLETRLRLVMTLGGGPVGAPLEQDIYIAPHAQKWVQFHPYLSHGSEDWGLEWDEGQGRLELPPAPLRKIEEQWLPTAVLLSDPDDVSGRGASLKRFPENLFPPHVTATDGLDAVVLDHVPRWEPARRQAFLDWLARGGTVHLLLDRDGRPPEFPDDLAALRIADERFHVGAGLVLRHQRSRTELDGDFIERVVLRETADRILPVKGETDEAEREARRAGDLYRADDQLWLDDFSGGVFQDLRGLSLPRYPWPLIYLLSLVYIVLLFPGCFVLGRRRVRSTHAYLALVGTIGLFSVVFAALGRRSYVEATAVRTLAVARPLRDGAWDVTGWSSAFVTRGATYAIVHGGTGRLYATAQARERIGGRIRDSGAGEFLVEIPPYSSRSFAWRARLPRDRPSLAVREWTDDGTVLESLAIETSEDFAADDDCRAFAVYRSEVYELSVASTRLSLNRTGVPLATFLAAMDDEEFWHYAYADVWGEERLGKAEPWRRLVVPLIADELAVRNRVQADAFQLPSDRVRVFVYAPLPEEFFVTGEELGRQSGRVLYCVDLLKPGTR